MSVEVHKQYYQPARLLLNREVTLDFDDITGHGSLLDSANWHNAVVVVNVDRYKISMTWPQLLLSTTRIFLVTHLSITKPSGIFLMIPLEITTTIHINTY